jgi:hypothetical protein
MNLEADKQLVTLIFSSLAMAAFQGTNESVYRKHRRYLIAPSEDDISNKFLGTLS